MSRPTPEWLGLANRAHGLTFLALAMAALGAWTIEHDGFPGWLSTVWVRRSLFLSICVIEFTALFPEALNLFSVNVVDTILAGYIVLVPLLQHPIRKAPQIPWRRVDVFGRASIVLMAISWLARLIYADLLALYIYLLLRFRSEKSEQPVEKNGALVGVTASVKTGELPAVGSTGRSFPWAFGVLATAPIVVLVTATKLQPLADPLLAPAFYVLYAAAGLVSLVGVCACVPGRIFARVTAGYKRLADWLDVSPLQAALLLLSPWVALLATLAAGLGDMAVHQAVSLLAWCGAICMAVGGGWQRSRRRVKIHPGIALAVVAIFGLALLLRLPDTAHIPVVFTGDEGAMGLTAQGFLRGTINNLFWVIWYGFPSLFFFLQSVSMSFLGLTVAALRIPSAIIGSVTVLVTFFAGRALFNWRVGLLASLFLAGMHFHIHFSRLAFNNIWDGLFFVAFVGALYVAWNQERRNAYLLAGLALGLGQYFYNSARVLVVFGLVWLVVQGALDRARFKRSLGNILVMGLVALACALPLLWVLLWRPDVMLGTFRHASLAADFFPMEGAQSGLPAWALVLKQVGLGLMAFTKLRLNWFYQPGGAILLTVAAAVFLTGVLLLAARWRAGATFALVLWMLAFGIIGGLSESTPASQRYVAVAPALALVIGFALDEMRRLLSLVWPGVQRTIMAGVFLAGILLAAGDASFYFYDFTPRSSLEDFNGYRFQRIAEVLSQLPAGEQIVFFGYPEYRHYNAPGLDYMTQHLNVLDKYGFWMPEDRDSLSGERVTFVFLRENELDVWRVVGMYPGGHLWRELDAQQRVLYWMYAYEWEDHSTRR
ncbi:MAG: hypothetical protein GYA17_01440 [Chloroflexi bacterium]|nr:hypothetical protein [Chloroflexota bacterium]